MTDVFAVLASACQTRLRAARAPRWTPPMLATLTNLRFSDSNWIFERKFDGQRVLAFRSGGSVRLLSRNQRNVEDTYPELADALSRQRCRNFIVDGEVVALAGSHTSFERLQQRMQIRSILDARAARIRVHYYLFDILHLNGYDTTALPLIARKKLLKRALQFEGLVRYTSHRSKEGEAYFRHACANGWEGIIAKCSASTYQHRRSSDWLKFKCAQGQELVIGGFTEPRGSAQGFGALLVGYYDNGRLRYAGKVGTGFTVELRLRLRRLMNKLVQKRSSFSAKTTESQATWISPTLVGEFAFSEWTRDGKLRHPSFRGLRNDKHPREITREAPVGWHGRQ
jgi:bifunctional non-homologous end joining protein LigD